MALDFVAGCIGGAAGVLVGHPFDTVKVRLQTSPASVYRGTIHCFTSVVKQESVLGLYKGLSSPLYSLAFINAIVFGIQGNVQRKLTNSNTVSSHMIAGASAGVAQSFICSPMELAKTRMQIQGQGQHLFFKNEAQKHGPFNCLWRAYKTNGLPGVFRGFWITVARDSSAFALYFSTYEYLCRTMTSQSQPSPFVLMLAGGMAGVSSWIFTYPVDVVKSRIQADGAQGFYAFSSYLDCYRKCVLEGGYSSLFRGFSATILRAFPVNATTFTAVTLILRYFGPEDDIANTSTNNNQPMDHLHISGRLAHHAELIIMEESGSAR